MSEIRETAFDLLFNAFVLIALFAIVTAILSRLIARARARYQFIWYVAMLVFCVTWPVIDTLWQSNPVAGAKNSPMQVLPQSGEANHFFWHWQNHLTQHEQFTMGPGVQSWVVAAWILFVLYRVVIFCRSVAQVNRLRREASVLSPNAVGMASHIIQGRHKVALLKSKAIDDPVTIGVFHPAILLPAKLLPELQEQDISAIIAHECGHIRREDFLTNLFCELISLPLVWHPGIRYIKSKISQTRELACDEYAATRLGQRRMYARSLLRLAQLCLHTPRGNTVALGIFDGDNLETRIMMLTNKRLSLTRAGVVLLTLATTLLLGSSAVLAHALSLQAGSTSSSASQNFAGTWHWMYNEKSFSTMVLVRNGSSYSGSVTPSRISLNDDGGLSKADPSENSAPIPIAKAEMKGSELHVKVIDGDQPFEFIVTLTDDTHAEIHPVGAPPNMKPIKAEKMH